MFPISITSLLCTFRRGFFRLFNTSIWSSVENSISLNSINLEILLKFFVLSVDWTQ